MDPQQDPPQSPPPSPPHGQIMEEPTIPPNQKIIHRDSKKARPNDSEDYENISPLNLGTWEPEATIH